MLSILKNLLYQDFNKLNQTNLANFKRNWARHLGRTPKDSQVLEAYRSLVAEGKLKPNPQFEKQLRVRRVRSQSGVTPFAVMTKPWPCPGQCTYCPLEEGMPKSYLSDEPAAQRAKKLNFDPYLQIQNRIQQLEETGHKPNKIELIVIGGTFSNYPKDYKLHFFKRMFDALNGQEASSLEEAQVLNETAARRVVGLSVETRPDWLTPDEIKLIRYLGVTKLQVGVQAFDENILKKIKRGHSLDDVAQAIRYLKNAGFKLCLHFMPNLPGSTPEHDLEMAKIMYQDPRFKPDFVKIYPTQVIPGTELYRQWERGEFETYDDQTMMEVLKQIKLITPPWVRIDRLVRDISKQWVKSGTHKTNMRQLIQDQLKREGKACQCIRCREIKDQNYNETPSLVTREIETLGGDEYMFSFEANNHLYSLLRLRLPHPGEEILFPELEKAALIREVHTFGVVVPVDAKDANKPQHKGFGRKLITHAEQVAKKHGYRKIAVISAIGTRNYYRKLGYQLEGLYMTKNL